MDYTADKRKELADTGDAMPDGSFPIVTKTDLANAIMSIGRANDADKPAVRRHIIKRARALNAVDLLPSSWNVH